MKRFMNKKVVAIGLTAGLMLGAAGAAFAYFQTTGGYGSGTASVGSAGAVTVAGISDLGCTNTSLTACSPALTVPDLAPSSLTDSNRIVDTVDYTITNATDADNYVTAADIDITSTWTEGSSPVCAPNDFSINGAAVTSTAGSATSNASGGVSETVDEKLLPSSDGTTAPGTTWTTASVNGDTYYGVFTLQLVENGANQDSCEAVTDVPLNVIAS